MVDRHLKEAQDKMHKAVQVTREELAVIRTGRASPKIVERIDVEYYGSRVPLNQIAGISVPEARMLVITPYDRNAVSAIEKAILASDLGINPSSDGTIIRLTFPPLTQDRRKDLIKVVRERAEEGKVAIRNIRRHVKDDMEHVEKDGQISEDDLRRLEKELQRVTDRFTSEIDDVVAAKEQELLEV
ncbi:MAG TPA: ribosome recycling factor [Actinomycetota bacterium]|nr:ribosome recycling factor [Actinomycetota bacterium]